ncbi:MAG: hypothetical protein IPI88_10705 [Chitinophagaceae bacterium]|nr:hypothetical protein [Chitinophagaceae bacterium]
MIWAYSLYVQSGAAITYAASATNTTGISYSLDAGSRREYYKCGNEVQLYVQHGWAYRPLLQLQQAVTDLLQLRILLIPIQQLFRLHCTSVHPGRYPDRIDPVATGITTTVQTAVLSSTGTTNTTFKLSPALCNLLTIKAQNISVQLYLTIASGTMPVNPNITALIKYGTTNIISLTNPVYNSGTKVLSWNGSLGADVMVPSGQPIDLVITTAQGGVTFRIDYHSMTKPSRISLLPVSTFIDFSSFDVYSAPYPGGVKESAVCRIQPIM